MASSTKTQQQVKTQSPIDLTQQQIIGLQKQTEEMFEKSVIQIYYHCIPFAKVDLFGEQCMDISTTKMNEIVVRHLQQLCDRHAKLIKQSIQCLMIDQASYHQSDQQLYIDILPFRQLVRQQQLILNSKDQQQKEILSKQLCLTVQDKKLQESCLWIIYQHFCSIAKANKQISLLIQIMEQNNEAIYIQCNAGKQNYDSLRSEKDHESYKENQLNQMTIRRIVPDNCFIKFTDFKELIDNISRCSGQNMRKYTRNIQKFTKSLQIGQPVEEQEPDINYFNSREVSMKYGLKIHDIFESFEDNFLQIMQSKLQKRSRSQSLQCYDKQGNQLNFHEYISMNNFDTQKLDDQQQIIDVDGGQVKKTKKKNKKKKKKNKKVDIEVDLLKQISGPPLLNQKLEEKEQKNRKPSQHEHVIEMFSNLNLQKEERHQVLIPKYCLQKWWDKFRNDHSP